MPRCSFSSWQHEQRCEMGFLARDVIMFHPYFCRIAIWTPNNLHYASTVNAFLSLECIALGMKLHCPHSRWSMTRNSIKGLVMQRPSIIYIGTGFYCVGISWAELCVIGLVRMIWIPRWHLGRGTNYQSVLIHLSCPTDSVFVCLCYRGPDTSWLSKHRHGASAKGCRENTHCYDAVCCEW